MFRLALSAWRTWLTTVAHTSVRAGKLLGTVFIAGLSVAQLHTALGTLQVFTSIVTWLL